MPDHAILPPADPRARAVGSFPLGGGFPLWAGALLLALALGAGASLKIEDGTYVPPVAGPDHSDRVEVFLQHNGFRLLPREGDADARYVTGLGRLGCRVTVVQAKTQGWDQHSVRQRAQPGDDFFVVFQDTLYDEHPRWRVKAYGYWDRVRRHFGIVPPERPAFAVIASPTCSVRSLPWQSLS